MTPSFISRGAVIAIMFASSVSASQSISTPAQSAPLSPVADTTIAQVRRAALDYLEGFYEGDTAKIIRSVRPNVAKWGFWRPRDSTAFEPDSMSYAEFITYARNVRARNRPVNPLWPKDVVVFDVQSKTASAKVTAWWGSDYLLLGKFGDRWMITHVLWQSPPK
jgi:putative lumazine-binding protein